MRLFNFTAPILLCHLPVPTAMSLNARAAWVLLDARPFLAFVLFICALRLCVLVVSVWGGACQNSLKSLFKTP